VLVFVISIAAKLPSPNPKTVDDVSKRIMDGEVVGALLVIGRVVLRGVVTTGVVMAGVVAVGRVTTGVVAVGVVMAGVVVADVVGRVEGMGTMTFVVGSEFSTDEVGASGFVAVELSGVDRTVVSTVT
jgi:hypothetical protein